MVQIEQDFLMCAAKFPSLICRAVAAMFVDANALALFEFERQDDVPRIVNERHYALVPPDDLSAEELAAYGRRPED